MILTACSIIGSPQKKVTGDYYLTQWEGGPSYYLDRRTKVETQGDGGKVEGVIQRIGWNEDLIIVNRQGINPPADDNWVVIDVRKNEVQGGFSDEQFMNLKRENPSLAQIEIYSAEDAWETLK